MEIFSSGILTTLFYCFGVIIPTLALLFTYGNFAFQIGEYNLEVKKLDGSMPIIVILLITKLFLISFVQFFIYHYIFDMTSIYNDILITVKCLLWGILICVDSFLLNKELVAVCKHVKTNKITNFRHHLYDESKKLIAKYKPLFVIKILLILLLIVCFVISLFTNNLSSLSLILLLYIYYNIRTNSYVNRLKHDFSDSNKK